MAYKSLHRTIMETNQRFLQEKAASNEKGEDYEARDAEEVDPAKTANTAHHAKNTASVETKGTNDSIAEEKTFKSQKEWNKALDDKYGRKNVDMKPAPAIDGAMAVTGRGNDLKVVGKWDGKKGEGTIKEEVYVQTSTFSEESLSQLTRLFGGRPKPLTEAKEDDKKKKDKKNPDKVKDKVDTNPELEDDGKPTMEAKERKGPGTAFSDAVKFGENLAAQGKSEQEAKKAAKEFGSADRVMKGYRDQLKKEEVDLDETLEESYIEKAKKLGKKGTQDRIAALEKQIADMKRNRKTLKDYLTQDREVAGLKAALRNMSHEIGEEMIQELTEKEEAKKEEIVKKLKEKKEDFQKKYGDRWESVIYATATKMAKKAVSEAIDANKDNVADIIDGASKKESGKAAVALDKAGIEYVIGKSSLSGYTVTVKHSDAKKADKVLAKAGIKESLDEVYRRSIDTSKVGRSKWKRSQSAPQGPHRTPKDKARTAAVTAGQDPEEIKRKEAARRKERMEAERQKMVARQKAAAAKKNEEVDLEETSYDVVFKAVAKHLNVDPDKIDQLDKDKKKQFFDMLDKSWDSKSNTVPDGAPISVKEAKDPISGKSYKHAYRIEFEKGAQKNLGTTMMADSEDEAIAALKKKRGGVSKIKSVSLVKEEPEKKSKYHMTKADIARAKKKDRDSKNLQRGRQARKGPMGGYD